MKKGIVSFLLLLLALESQAQIDVAWGGQQIANPKNSHIERIIGGNDSYVYALKVKARGSRQQTHFSVDAYARKSLGFVSSKEFYLPPQREEIGLLERIFFGARKYRIPEIEKIFLIQNKFLVFSSFYSRDKKKYYAYMQYISMEGAPIGIYQLVDSISTLSKRSKGSFDFILSEDQSRILVFHNEPYNKNTNERFSYKVLDPDLHTLWSKNLEMPYPDKQFHINSYRIDNAGNVYMLAHIDKNKEEVSLRKPTYIYSILAYFCREDRIKEYKMDLGNEFISDAAFNINPAGDLVCTGFYSKNSESNQIGVFYLKIDRKTKEVAERSIREFDKDFLMEFMTERKIDKGRELYNFDIGHLLLRDDGSALMVAEQYYMDVVSYYNPASHSYNYTYHYYYNDIIVVGFDPKGQISLLKKISKYQHSVNDGGPFASYVLVDGGDLVHFIYNDNPENIHRPESEIEHGHVSSMNNPGRSVVVMVSMDMKGQTQRTQLLDNHSRKNASWFRPKVNKKISDKDIILFSSRGKYYRFGRVTL